ncbi:MAG: GHMP kinase [bacterium]|nr:GHMP kinase [bacterium]
MIISKTPLRMSFVGGGSDLPSFYERSEGAVITSTIDKYIYVTVNKKFDGDIRLSYSKTENVRRPERIKHPIVREVLRKLNIPGGVEITSIADIPSKGTGLGSSSAFTVGLLNALQAYNRQFSSPRSLAKQACEIEMDILKEPIGRQDQHSVAYGGFNKMLFHEDHRVSVHPVVCLPNTKRDLEKNILLLYTGISRKASGVLSEQSANLDKNKKLFTLMKKMVALAHDFHTELQKNALGGIGDILHTGWMYKKEMATGITSPDIDRWYTVGRQNGALGGKVLGAGGGGFLMFYAPLERHEAIVKALPKLRPVPVCFEPEGSKIIFIHE